MRLRINRKFRDSDNVNSSTNSTSCSTKNCRHISSSEEDTENDHDVNDDNRLSVKVKHNEYADPPLEGPLKTLNIVVTRGNDEQPQQQQQIAQVQTVEDGVSDLFAYLVEDKELGPPVRNNLSQVMQNVWQTNIVTEKNKKIYEKTKTPENFSFLEIPRMNQEIFSQVSPQAKSHDAKLQKH